MTVPIAPESTMRLISGSGGVKRSMNPNWRTFVDDLAAWTTRSASSSVSAIGFWQKTCLPAASASFVMSA